MRVFIIYLVCVILCVTAYKFKVDKAMENEHIVPDVIVVAPKTFLRVNYQSGVRATLGNELTPTQVKDQPSVAWNGDHHSFYTICLTDPDIPSRAAANRNDRSEWHHWLVGNIPGTNLSEGVTLTAYVGSGTPPKTGLHRYVFLVYKQPSKLTFDEPRISNRTAEKRDKFSIHKFALKYNLGTPVAGNFYQAQYDEYVPILYQQLGIS